METPKVVRKRGRRRLKPYEFVAKASRWYILSVEALSNRLSREEREEYEGLQRFEKLFDGDLELGLLTILIIVKELPIPKDRREEVRVAAKDASQAFHRGGMARRRMTLRLLKTILTNLRPKKRRARKGGSA